MVARAHLPPVHRSKNGWDGNLARQGKPPFHSQAKTNGALYELTEVFAVPYSWFEIFSQIFWGEVFKGRTTVALKSELSPQSRPSKLRRVRKKGYFSRWKATRFMSLVPSIGLGK